MGFFIMTAMVYKLKMHGRLKERRKVLIVMDIVQKSDQNI